MKKLSIEEELKNNSYPGRGIIIGKTPDGKKAVTAYFIMGRSGNSRNRIFVEDGEGIRTQAFDPSKLEDPSLIIYAPVRVLGNIFLVVSALCYPHIGNSLKQSGVSSHAGADPLVSMLDRGVVVEGVNVDELDAHLLEPPAPESRFLSGIAAAGCVRVC